MKPTHRYCRLMISSLTSLLVLLAGCASQAVNIRAGDGAEPPSPAAYDVVAPPGRIGILEAEMFLYDVSAGGVLEYREDWSGSASGQTAKSAALMLRKMGYSPLIIPDPNRARDIFRLKTQMRYHSNAFQSDFFTEKWKNRDFPGANDTTTYSIGPIDSLCQRHGVDGFLYVYGFGEKLSNERRQFLNRGGGGAGPDANPAERTFVAVILADREGRITWYKHAMASGGVDMRTEAHSLRMMGALFD